MSSATLFLPRLGCSHMKLKPPCGSSPDVTRPRCGSPVFGCSILMTSAPQSARIAPADGTNHHCATSSTRIPSRGLSIRRLPLVSADRARSGADPGAQIDLADLARRGAREVGHEAQLLGPLLPGEPDAGQV